MAEELYDKVIQIALAGIDINNAANIKEPCKWGAYLGMCCTDSRVVTTPCAVVVSDYEQEITEHFDVVTGHVVKNPAKDKKGVDYLYELDTQPQNNVEKTISITPFDGAGLVDVSLAKKWAEELKLKYIPSAWQFRASAGIKGNVYTFDIKQFAETYHVHTIKDRWGKSHEIFNKKHELKINCILTESQVKFTKMFSSQKDLKDKFATKEFGYSRTFNISDVCIPDEKLKKHCVMSYQPLQSLELTDKEIETLCADTVNQVEKIHTDIDSFIKWRGLDRDEEEKSESEKYTNPALLALKYNHSLVNDEYIHTVVMDNLKRYRAVNHIRLRVMGNYQVFIPDLYALCQSAFGLLVTGLLQAGQVYNLYWHNQGADEITMIRFPHIAREHYLVNVAGEESDNWEEMQTWYQYQNVGYISSIHDSLALRLGGADYDNDHVYGVADKTICEAVKRNPANTIYFERDQEGEAKANKKVQFADYDGIAMSDYVGMKNEIGNVVNATSQLWSMITPQNGEEENKKIYDYVKVMSVIDSLTIDFAKTGIKADRSKEIKTALKGNHNPWFMQFRAQKVAGNIKQAESIALQNNQSAETNYSKTNSTMNRIADYMDSHIANLTGKYNVPDFDWTTLLQGCGDPQDSVKYQNVLKKLKDLHHKYSKQVKKINANSNDVTQNDEDNARAFKTKLNLLFADCRNQLLQVQPDINMLIDDVITVYYTDEKLNRYRKSIIWNCFPSQMITRCKGKTSRGKIYDLEKLKAQHDKIVEKQKEQIKKAQNKIEISNIDSIKKQISITNADKKYINSIVKSQRAKKLYYAFLFLWLKLQADNPQNDHIEVKCHANDDISKTQICKIAGIKNTAYRDAITSLQEKKLIVVLEANTKRIVVSVNYARQVGEKIKLPKTCLKMRHWINRNIPLSHRHEESRNYKISDFHEKAQPRKKPVMCVETGEIFDSAKDACKKTTINQGGINMCCLGKHQTAGRLHWRYVD